MSDTPMVPSSGNQQASSRQAMRRGDDIDPFLVLRREMDRVFDDMLRGFGMPSFPQPAFGRVPAPVLAPHIDVSETDREVRIAAELPGIHEQNVEVSLADDILTIRGEKRVEQEEKDRDYRIIERARGSFSRSLRIPFKVDPAQVQATMKDGVLTVIIPKPREVQERTSRIEVTRQERRDADLTSVTARPADGTPSSSAPANGHGSQQHAAE